MNIGFLHDKKVNTILFDCDGVILNSNNLKTQAFYKAALPYGDEAATTLAAYHVKNGGVSRNHKFEYFLTKIIPEGVSGPGFSELVNTFSIEVKKGLLGCEVSLCLSLLRKKMEGVKWFIVSGGAQGELKEVFQMRGLYDMFDGGIYGSPRTKDEILSLLIKDSCLEFPALFLGDSRYDHEASKRANIDFLFVSGWSEFQDWRSYCASNNIASIESLCGLL